MKLEEYFRENPHSKRPESKKDKTFGNYSFITELFYPTWGERGLDRLENEFNFVDVEAKVERFDDGFAFGRSPLDYDPSPIEGSGQAPLRQSEWPLDNRHNFLTSSLSGTINGPLKDDFFGVAGESTYRQIADQYQGILNNGYFFCILMFSRLIKAVLL